MIMGKFWAAFRAQVNKLANFFWTADPIAQNTQARKASFRQQGTNVTDATLAPLKTDDAIAPMTVL
jgi:hypothetical protein